jgi:hypothetical protein
MQEATYTLKKGTEFPERFAGLEARYSLPSTLDEIRALVAPEANADEVIVAGFNGQGYNLSVQKRIKDVLASEAVKEMTPEEGLAHAIQVATTAKLGAPRTRAAGGGAKAKVERAEARADAAVATAAEMYRRLPKNLRRQMREVIVSQGVLTEAQLDEIDSEG